MEFSAIASGSSGNCIYVSSRGTGILIDVGITGKRVLANLAELEVEARSNLQAILVTHEHKDHISGVGVVARRCGLDIWANGPTWEGMRPFIGEVPQERERVFVSGTSFAVGEIQVTSFRTSHDSAESVGYLLDDGSTRLAIATDTGVLTPEVLKVLKEAQYLLIESNHDLAMLQGGRYPWYLKKRVMSELGHLSNGAAAAGVEFLVKHGRVAEGGVLLGHLSQENNLPELALETVCARLSQAGIRPGQDLAVDLAWRDRRTPLYKVG